MKKIITVLFVAFSLSVSAQSMQIQNMVNYLRNKDYEKAKASADAAAVHESTKTSPKMWMTRGNVYITMSSDTSRKVKALDPEADEKALDAYTNALKYDKDNIYKEDVKNNFILAGNRVNFKAGFYRDNKQYENALKCYDLLEAALPYDTDGSFKKNKITLETIMFNKFLVYKFSGDKAKAKEYANKLMDNKYSDPKLYVDMSATSLREDRDTTAALGYIEKGKQMFPSNMDLITLELDIYLARKKTDALKDKLQSAINISPNNEVLHFVLANLYKSTGKFEESEKEYLKVLEIKPDYEPGNYNLAVLYYGAGKDWNDKLNKLPVKDPKEKDYQAKSNDYFKKAIVYFEKSYEVTKEAGTKKLLRQLSLRTGETEKAEKYK